MHMLFILCDNPQANAVLRGQPHGCRLLVQTDIASAPSFVRNVRPPPPHPWGISSGDRLRGRFQRIELGGRFRGSFCLRGPVSGSVPEGELSEGRLPVSISGVGSGGSVYGDRIRGSVPERLRGKVSEGRC